MEDRLYINLTGRAASAYHRCNRNDRINRPCDATYAGARHDRHAERYDLSDAATGRQQDDHHKVEYPAKHTAGAGYYQRYTYVTEQNQPAIRAWSGSYEAWQLRQYKGRKITDHSPGKRRQLDCTAECGRGPWQAQGKERGRRSYQHTGARR